jgi:hypothetical protein
MGFRKSGVLSRRCCSQQLELAYMFRRSCCGKSNELLQNSLHLTDYASKRPDVLGSNLERTIKDYNGQTYWLSVNLHSFFKQSKIPNGLI